MPLPSILDVAHRHLFSDHDQMIKAGLNDITIRRLERLRDVYSYWVNFPSKRDRDIIHTLRSRYCISDSTAREDLKMIKTLLGDLQRVSKDYMRYRVSQMLERAYDRAVAADNPAGMVAAAKELARIHQLDKDDERADIIDKVVPVVLSFTDDPAVIGIARMPDFREKIKALKERYWTEATEEIEFEELDANLDEIFKPAIPIHGEGTSESLPQ